MEEQPEVGQYCVSWVDGVQYGGKITEVTDRYIMVQRLNRREILCCSYSSDIGGYKTSSVSNYCGLWREKIAAAASHPKFWFLTSENLETL